jgi:hypothetical protein
MDLWLCMDLWIGRFFLDLHGLDRLDHHGLGGFAWIVCICIDWLDLHGLGGHNYHFIIDFLQDISLIG